jgi:hypothetical protein
MFFVMKEHAKLIRAAYAFQVLLVHLENRRIRTRTSPYHIYARVYSTSDG